LRNAGGGGDGVHAGAVEALCREQAFGGLQDRRAFLQVLRAARAAGFGYGKRNHDESNTGQYRLVMVYYTTAFNIFIRSATKRIVAMSAFVHLTKITLAAAVIAGALDLSGCSSHAAAPEAPRYALVAHPQSAEAARAEVYSGDVHARYESQLGF